MKIAIEEAKNKLLQYGEMAHGGVVVTVCKRGRPWFDLVPHGKKAQKRKVTPLPGVRSVVTEKQALKPVKQGDIAGWI